MESKIMYKYRAMKLKLEGEDGYCGKNNYKRCL